MAESNWKYATLSEKERLDMVKSGDNDVYETEMARNNYYINMRKDLGVDTSDLENWALLLNQAKASRENSYKVSKIEGTPTYYGARTNKIMNSFNSYMEQLNQTLNQQKTEAIGSAATAIKTLKEFLANNGYSQDGTTAKKKSDAITELLENKLFSIDADYQSKAENAVKNAKSAVASLK